MRRLGEIELIARYLAPLAWRAESLGLVDDAALLPAEAAAEGLVITTDALVAGVHFFTSDAPFDVAYKAVAVNVSDLAAKGAEPYGYTLALGLSEPPTETWAEGLAGGLAEAQRAFGIDLLGGDTVSTKGPWFLSITALGRAGERFVPRSGARPGDFIYLSGTLGDGALGLKLRLDTHVFGDGLPEEHKAHLLARYLRPEPRLALRGALLSCASAAMDVSDGLMLDLSRLCAASGVGAKVVVERLPLSAAAAAILAQDGAHLETVVAGGDDYEILATVTPARAGEFERLCEEAGVRVARIGQILEHGAPVALVHASGEPVSLSAKGFQHFG